SAVKGIEPPFRRGLGFLEPLIKAILSRQMNDETLDKIEERIRSADSVDEARRAELLKQIATLKAEVARLSKANPEHAQSILGFTNISTHEATRSTVDPKLRQLSLDGLASSVAGLEESHPNLVGIVNSICVTLSNLGI